MALAVALVALAPSASALADETSKTMLVYAESDATAGSRVWDSSAWAAEVQLPSTGSMGSFVGLGNCPTRDEHACAVINSSKQAYFTVATASTWGSATQVCTNVGTELQRLGMVAYEQQSGDCLVAYYDDDEKNIGYRIFNGTTLSGESDLATPGSQKVEHLDLYSSPTSDQIVLIALFSNDNLAAAVWSGSAWGGWTTFTTTIAAKSSDPFSMAFEGQSGDGLAVYSESGASQPRYRTWTGSGWSGEGSLPSTGSAAHPYLAAAGRPGGDQVLFGALDFNKQVSVNVWSGSAWGTNTAVETDTGATDRRVFDVGFEHESSEGMVVYCEASLSQLRYRTWNGSSWSTEQLGANIGATPNTILVDRGPAAGEMFIVTSDNAQDINSMIWSGSAMSAAVELEASTGTNDKNQPFMLAVSDGTGVEEAPKVVRWREVPNPDPGP